MSAKLPYLEKSGGVYYFRRRLPSAGASCLRGIMRFSLHTKNRQTAIACLLRCCLVFEKFTSLPIEEAANEVAREIAGALMFRDFPTPEQIYGWEAFVPVASKILHQAENELPDYEDRFPLVRQMLVDLAKRSAYQRYNHEMVEMMEKKERSRKTDEATIKISESLETLTKSIINKYDRNIRVDSIIQNEILSEARFSNDSSKEKHDRDKIWTIAILAKSYLDGDGKKTGADNKRNIERAVALWEAVVTGGSTRDVREIGHDDFTTYRDWVGRLPKVQGVKIDQGFIPYIKSHEEKCVAEGRDVVRLSVTTANNSYIDSIARLLKLLPFDCGEKRPPRDFRLKGSKRKSGKTKRREPITIQEFQRCMRAPPIVGRRSVSRPYSSGNAIIRDDRRYWAVPIAGMTGMRATEIGMLNVDQFQEFMGYPTIMLELDADADKALGYKSNAAVRRVPIHPNLIEMGLLDYVNFRRNKGQSCLFPDWPKHVKTASDGEQEVHFEADFFNEQKSAWGIEEIRQKKVSFHSLRGFFISRCDAAKIDPYTKFKWVGHDEQNDAKMSDTHAHYKGSDLLDHEVSVISELDFGEFEMPERFKA